MTDTEVAEKKLKEECERRSFSFSVHYSDVTGTYEAMADGVGHGENVRVKGFKDMKSAIVALAESVREKFPK